MNDTLYNSSYQNGLMERLHGNPLHKSRIQGIAGILHFPVNPLSVQVKFSY